MSRIAGCCAALLATAFPLAAQTRLLIVSGVGGDPSYSQQFYEWGSQLADAAVSRMGLARSDVVFLAERPERASSPVDGIATKEGLAGAWRTLAARAGPDDDIIMVLFGHGSDRGDEPRFNLVGPDITAKELADLLADAHAKHTVVVNASSASGGFVKALSGPGRIVVTATKSGMERNRALFGRYFVQALAADGADTDKDGRVSVLEAFAFAQAEVARAYEKDSKLLTEHAVLDDNGDGVGSATPSATGGDGALASAVFFNLPGAGAVATNDPSLRPLYARRDSLERKVAELRAGKAILPPDEYARELESLLVELATTTRAIRERQGIKPP